MRIKLDGNVKCMVKFEGFPLNSALFSVGEIMTTVRSTIQRK